MHAGFRDSGLAVPGLARFPDGPGANAGTSAAPPPPGIAVAMEELNQQAEHLRRVVEALRSKLGLVLRPVPPNDVLRADTPDCHAPRCDLAEGILAFARIVREGRESIEEIIARVDV